MKKVCFFSLLIIFVCLLAGCSGQKKNFENRACSDIADEIQQAASFRELTDMKEKYMEKYLLISTSSLSDWVMRKDASNVTPEMILILRVKDGEDQAAMKDALRSYLQEQILLYRDYQPGEVFKLTNASVLENENYLALIISPDKESVNKSLGEEWN